MTEVTCWLRGCRSNKGGRCTKPSIHLVDDEYDSIDCEDFKERDA